MSHPQICTRFDRTTAWSCLWFGSKQCLHWPLHWFCSMSQVADAFHLCGPSNRRDLLFQRCWSPFADPTGKNLGQARGWMWSQDASMKLKRNIFLLPGNQEEPLACHEAWRHRIQANCELVWSFESLVSFKIGETFGCFALFWTHIGSHFRREQELEEEENGERFLRWCWVSASKLRGFPHCKNNAQTWETAWWFQRRKCCNRRREKSLELETLETAILERTAERSYTLV